MPADEEPFGRIGRRAEQLRPGCYGRTVETPSFKNLNRRMIGKKEMGEAEGPEKKACAKDVSHFSLGMRGIGGKIVVVRGNQSRGSYYYSRARLRKEEGIERKYA